MIKTIFITGATDGIGLETAKMLAGMGHNLLLHGRSQEKLAHVEGLINKISGRGQVKGYICDLSNIRDVDALGSEVMEENDNLDVLINNAGVFSIKGPALHEGLDLRFLVNTIAPYLLTRKLLSLLGPSGRVINLSSAAQAPVDPRALAGQVELSDGQAYAQSKLALTMWSRIMGESLKDRGPAVIAVNPASLLGTKMVKQAFGVSGGDLGIGTSILCRAALSEEFASASGKYFDNDSGNFALPHPDVFNRGKCEEIISFMDSIVGPVA